MERYFLREMPSHLILTPSRPMPFHLVSAAPNGASYLFLTFCALSVAVAALIVNVAQNLQAYWEGKALEELEEPVRGG